MVFVDTSFFKAFIDEKDEFHKPAVSILEHLEKEEEFLVTTNYILDETMTLIRVKCGLQRVKDLREALVCLRKLKIVRVLVVDEKNAWNWFWNEWSKLSFTDCVSFAVMKRLGIDGVATFDDHFVKAGFKRIES